MKRLTEPIWGIKGVRNVEYKVVGFGLDAAHELTVTGGDKQEIAKTINYYRAFAEGTSGTHMETVEIEEDGTLYQIRFNYIE